MPKKVLRKRPGKLTLIVTIAAVCIIAIVALALTLLGRGETIQPELHRSVFTTQGLADSAGSPCLRTAVNGTDYCINPGNLSMPDSGKYAVDASYRFGQKTFQFSDTTSPHKETVPTIFIEQVYSITPVKQ